MKLSIVDILTLSSLIVAFVTWFLTYLKSKRDNKIANTVSMINSLSTVAHLNAADLLVRKLIEKESEHLDFKNEDEEALIIILDYYEFLTHLYSKNLIHRDSFNHLRGSLVNKTFSTARNFIQKKRDLSNRTDLYAKLEAFCES